APVVQGGSTLTVREDQTGEIPVTITDPDAGDSSSIRVTQGEKGAVTVVGNTVTYTPNEATRLELLAGQSLPDEFTYTVTDSKGAEGATTVSVRINGLGNTGVISTGEQAPVDVEFDGDWGIIRDADGTLAEV